MPRRAEKVPSQADGNKRTNKQTNKLGKEHKSRENLVNNEKNGSGIRPKKRLQLLFSHRLDAAGPVARIWQLQKLRHPVPVQLPLSFAVAKSQLFSLASAFFFKRDCEWWGLLGPLLIWPETPPMKSFPPQFNPSRLGHWIIWILRPTLIDLFTSFALVQIKFDASFKIVVGHIKGIFELFKGNLIMLKAW